MAAGLLQAGSKGAVTQLTPPQSGLLRTAAAEIFPAGDAEQHSRAGADPPAAHCSSVSWRACRCSQQRCAHYCHLNKVTVAQGWGRRRL